MIKNILLYIFILASAFIFNIYYYAWFSWFLFIIVLCIPFISLIVSLPFMIQSAANGFMIYCDDEIKLNQNLEIGLVFRKQRFGFCPRVKAKLKVHNNFSKVNAKIKIIHSGTFAKPYFTVNKNLGNFCGCCEFSVRHCRVYDLTGIFFIPAYVNKSFKTFVMPQPQKPQNIPDFDNMTILGYKPKSGGGFSDYYELRPYQNGDSIKSIHWKLSSKHDNIIIKEPSQPITKEFAVNAVLTENAQDNKSVLSRLMYVCSYINEQDSDCYAFANGYKGISKIKNDNELKMFIKSLYQNLPYNDSEFDRCNSIVYRITRDGEEAQTD